MPVESLGARFRIWPFARMSLAAFEQLLMEARMHMEAHGLPDGIFREMLEQTREVSKVGLLDAYLADMTPRVRELVAFLRSGQ